MDWITLTSADRDWLMLPLFLMSVVVGLLIANRLAVFGLLVGLFFTVVWLWGLFFTVVWHWL